MFCKNDSNHLAWRVDALTCIIWSGGEVSSGSGQGREQVQYSPEKFWLYLHTISNANNNHIKLHTGTDDTNRFCRKVKQVPKCCENTLQPYLRIFSILLADSNFNFKCETSVWIKVRIQQTPDPDPNLIFQVLQNCLLSLRQNISTHVLALALLRHLVFILMTYKGPRQWWAKLLRLLTVNSLSQFVKIKY